MPKTEEKNSSSSSSSQTQNPNQKPTKIQSKLLLLLLLISSNLLTIFLLSPTNPFSFSRPTFSTPCNSQSLLRELNSTQLLLSDLRRHLQPPDNDNPPDELKLAVGPHKLPFGFTPNLDTDELRPSLGSACRLFPSDLSQFMTYPLHGTCPPDHLLSQHLLLKGCEPLPRRRCRPQSPPNYLPPLPFPSSLWSLPPDSSTIWDPYSCKNYSCLINRATSKGSFDCKDCFDLKGREKTRWLTDQGLDYSIDEVLRRVPKGSIRIGLDIGGGTGTFAARMRERNITIATTSMNFDAPFNNFIAGRGLLPLYVSVVNRLPFFDHTLDIVHSMHVLSEWIPGVVLEFALFDVYRVLRPGGLFWVDHFFCDGGEMNLSYVPMFERIGFRKLRWDVGRKLDRGVEKNEWYLSALLQKPIT